jgi:6-phospho-beta-glucosidase
LNRSVAGGPEVRHPLGRPGPVNLAILGGGGARIPRFVRTVLQEMPDRFRSIRLLEPDSRRTATLGRLASEIARHAGRDEVVTLTTDAEEALDRADFVFSALRVGGDRGRQLDEAVALDLEVVGQETVGAGGCAMALRTIPVALHYCEILRRVSPDAVVINFTNPAGIITQALVDHGGVSVVGVCDTPSSTIRDLVGFLDVPQSAVRASYCGINHLGWVTSLQSAGRDLLAEVIERFEEVRRGVPHLAGFDPELVRHLGVVPTEYLYYYYYPRRYTTSLKASATTRGLSVSRLNAALVGGLGKVWDARGTVEEAWAMYASVMAERERSYMTGDIGSDCVPGRVDTGDGSLDGPDRRGPLGGYEAVALDVITGLSPGAATRAILNVPNGTGIPWLEPDDVIECPCVLQSERIEADVSAALPRSAKALVMQVKEYERRVVDASREGSRSLAALALAQHPLVPGVDVARRLMDYYVANHGEGLAYLV